MMKDIKKTEHIILCKWKIFLKGVYVDTALLLNHFLKLTVKFSTNKLIPFVKKHKCYLESCRLKLVCRGAVVGTLHICLLLCGDIIAGSERKLCRVKGGEWWPGAVLLCWVLFCLEGLDLVLKHPFPLVFAFLTCPFIRELYKILKWIGNILIPVQQSGLTDLSLLLSCSAVLHVVENKMLRNTYL